jgi:multiple sugar transport system substrate-binding protein
MYGGWSTNPKGMAGIELFVQLRDAGVFADGTAGLTHDAAAQMYLSGQSAMLFDGSWSYSVPPAELQATTQLGGFPLPSGSPWSKPIYWAGYTGKGVWISRNGSQKLSPVGEFVRFLYQEPVIARFVTETAMVPPLKDVTVDTSQLNPLFAASIDMDDRAEMASLWADVPADAFAGWLNVSKLAYVPGTTAAEIAEGLDASFEQ